MRNLRNLDEAGLVERAIQVVAASPTAKYDQAVLRARARGDWYRSAVRAFEALPRSRS